MSYCEDIFEKTLKLILKSSIKVKRNYRPNWLKNPRTKKCLELDFYIPEINLGFEIQGQHHFDNREQKERDLIKEAICKSKQIKLVQLSIFQNSPSFVFKTIVKYQKENSLPCIVKKWNKDWLNFNKEISQYRLNIIGRFGRSKCTFPIRNKKEILDLEFLDIAKVKLRNKETRIQVIHPIKINESGVECRILGTSEIVTIRPSCIIAETVQ
jgi:hypothetical protein